MRNGSIFRLQWIRHGSDTLSIQDSGKRHATWPMAGAIAFSVLSIFVLAVDGIAEWKLWLSFALIAAVLGVLFVLRIKSATRIVIEGHRVTVFRLRPWVTSAHEEVPLESLSLQRCQVLVRRRHHAPLHRIAILAAIDEQPTMMLCAFEAAEEAEEFLRSCPSQIRINECARKMQYHEFQLFWIT